MSNLKEEKMEILKMVSEGKISHDEGLELLDALESPKINLEKKSLEGKWLRIKVNEKDGATKVNVNLPLALIEVGLKIGSKFSDDLDNEVLKGIDFDEILEMIKNGASGKILEVEESEENTKIEIYVD